jgi:dinuclear metal center YbgI/SA1388 family protein
MLTRGLKLRDVVTRLHAFAPLNRAESWDNVGLLIEPTRDVHVERVLLTNDLTSVVVKEASDRDVQLVVTYHPILFSATKKLDKSQRIAVACIERGIAVFSHHTAIDAKAGGVNDWLIESLASRTVDAIRPLTHSAAHAGFKVISFCPLAAVERVRLAMADAGAGVIGEYDLCSFASPGRGSFRGSAKSNPTLGSAGVFEQVDEVKLEMVCGKSALAAVIEAHDKAHPYETPAREIVALADVPIADTGMGRHADLKQALSLHDAIERIKRHLGLPHVRLARAYKHDRATPNADIKISSVAVCAGSGGAVLRGVRADLLVTGEMSHHELLAAVESGSNVVLCEHSNTERGYISGRMRHELQQLLGENVQVLMSNLDRDPVEHV